MAAPFRVGHRQRQRVIGGDMKTTLQSEARRDTASKRGNENAADPVAPIYRRQGKAIGLLILLAVLSGFGGIAGLAVGVWTTSASADTEIVVTDVCDTGAAKGGAPSTGVVGCAVAPSFASDEGAFADPDDPSTWSSFVTSVRLTVPFPRVLLGGVARVLD